jgi:hypothetical protein
MIKLIFGAVLLAFLNAQLGIFGFYYFKDAKAIYNIKSLKSEK